MLFRWAATVNPLLRCRRRFFNGATSGVSAKIAVRSSSSTAAYGDMARARTDLVSGVDSAARPEDYRVGASEEIPGTLEAQGEHETPRNTNCSPEARRHGAPVQYKS